MSTVQTAQAVQAVQAVPDIARNPVRPADAPAAPAVRKPILVTCVVGALQDAAAENIQVIKKFVLEKGLLFETREYNSWSSNHDRDQIERLPAFHLYMNSIYQTTFYPDGRPLQIILDTMRRYEEKLERRRERSGRLRTFLERLVAAIRSMGKRETRMERYQRERATVAAKPDPALSSRRALSMKDWN